jgi:protein involved in polysaccharide export with SLBB domain
MDRTILARSAVWLTALIAFGPLGCSTGPGNTFTLFPEGHKLIDSARYLRASQSDPWPIHRELDKGLAPPWVVEPGDVILVQPVKLDSPVRLPGDQTVLPDGSIRLGQYGSVVVAGKTLAQIEGEVNALVGARARDAGPITVRLVTRDSKVYYVLGEVNAPGAFQLKGRETVLDAILAAGGLTSGASRKKIILSRPTPPDSCRVVLPICYNEIVQLGDTSTNYQIKAGDRVYVPTRSCWEQLLPHRSKEECPPCNRPQAPCPPPAPAGHPHGPVPFMPPPAPAQPAAPEAPPVAAPAAPADLPAPSPAGQVGQTPDSAGWRSAPGS